MPQTLFLGGRPLLFLIILLCVSPFLYGGGLCDPNANCIVDFGLLGKASDPLCESKKLL